mgnify:CR=1 FL=1
MFFDRPDSGELAILVHLELGGDSEANDLREFEELVLSAGGDPVALLGGSRRAPRPSTFVGSGKLEELEQLVRQTEAQLVIFNHVLSPTQERNLEQALCCRVLDRTGLILDIFAQRARTHEGKLQVELAQLQHVMTRLVRGWTHLERQKGGIGLRGPGETQLETDRRLIRARVNHLGKRLEKVRKQRDLGRRSRQRSKVPTISLTGYTNAGKSTLFNRLTHASVLVEDKLFATLDPTMRRLQLSGLGPTVFADTVGFVNHLPHQLVDAFRATLEEAANADLLLHVIDAASENRAENMTCVDEVLEQIGAAEVPVLKVYNKIDLLSDRSPRVDRDAEGKPIAVWLSAQQNAGLELLLEAVVELVGGELIADTYYLKPEQGRLRARFHQLDSVLSERPAGDGGTIMEIRMSALELRRLLKHEGVSDAQLISAAQTAVGM